MASMVEQPCTKLEYKVQNADEQLRYHQHNGIHRRQIIFAMYFGNPKVKVYLEYIIYDFVATISAVGGTLGSHSLAWLALSWNGQKH